MKTLEQYIAERRRYYEPIMVPADMVYGPQMLKEFEEAGIKDAYKEMPRVLDMLERQQKALDYIAQFESHDKGLNKILLKAREAKEDLERMVNE